MAIGGRVLSDNAVVLPPIDMPAHPLADLFPLIEGQQFDELVASIREPVQSIALAFKALNAAHIGAEMKRLTWQSQGQNAEAFPKLNIIPDKAEAA